MDTKLFYLTTAINYPNGRPHLGHAYEAVACDIMMRYRRLRGGDTYFTTGADEHGLKMQKTATDMGITPAELVDQKVPVFQDLIKALNISVDDYTRTSQPRHHKASQAIWRRMAANGDIYLGGYEGWYSVRDEAYYTESEVSKNDDGVMVGPQGTPVEWTEEPSYFFRLSDYQDRLLALYESQPDFIGPASRRNEIISFVRGGLHDLSISRKSLTWGVSVPDDPDHVMYVWVDALTSYLTGLGFPDLESELFQKFWPASAHVIGKDIIRFHAVYWPAFLMSAGLPLPKRVFAHGFLLVKGEKMSKSIGNVIDPFDSIQAFGVDAFRYFLAREFVFSEDGSFSAESMIARMNADLANDLGNLAQRSLSMLNKHAEGIIPEYGTFHDDDLAIFARIEALIPDVDAAVADFKLNQMPILIWTLVAAANRYFAGNEPWVLRKSDPARFHTVLYVTLECLRAIGLLIQALMPASAERLLDMIGVPVSRRELEHYGEKGRLEVGTELPVPEVLFPRYVQED